MRKFNEYEKAQKITDIPKLPKGGYVLKIMKAEVVAGYNGCDSLKFNFDIAEGEFKDYFMKSYQAQTAEDKKWKGVFFLNAPDSCGEGQRAQITANKFKTNISAIEESNNGYVWDWDETKLKGKLVGGVFIEKEYDYNGRHGWFTTCWGFKPVDKIRKGEFKQPADKPLNRGYEGNVSNYSLDAPPPVDPFDETQNGEDSGNDDLPFQW